MDAAPSFSASMHRLSRVSAVALAAALLVPAAAASADPRIQDVTLTNSGVSGEPLGIDVTAIDPSSPITAVDVRFPGHPGGFSESACTLKPNGKPDFSQQGGYGKNKTSSFKVPWVPQAAGQWAVSVRVTSGACGTQQKHAKKQVSFPIGLADVPVFPVKGNGKKRATATAAAVNLSGCGNAYLLPTTKNGRRIRGAIACLINVTRSQKGLPTLKSSARLRKAAGAHTRDMVTRHYFDHQGPSGPSFVTRLQSVGYWPATAGENIAYGGGVLATPYAIWLAWMNSDGHRENILNPKVRELGTGVAFGAPDDPLDGATYTTDFGIKY